MKNNGNGVDRVALLEALGEWMFGQCYARKPFVVMQGSFEKDL